MRCGYAAMAIAFPLSGCGSARVVAEPAQSSAVDPVASEGLDGPVIRYREGFANGGEAAVVAGVVEIEGDCLYLSDGESSERFPVVWPASTSWDPGSGRVLLPNGDSVGHGDTVFGGGGYHDVGDVADVADDAAATRAGECVDNQYGEIAFVNNQADGIAAGDGAHPDRGSESEAYGADFDGAEGEWLVRSLSVTGTIVEPDASVPLTVIIQGDVISGTAGCNQFDGTIDWSSEAGFGRFVVSDLQWTEMACDSQAMELEQAFRSALESVDSYEIADGLYVSNSGGSPGFHLVPAGSTG